jgi:hypothetical protein
MCCHSPSLLWWACRLIAGKRHLLFWVKNNATDETTKQHYACYICKSWAVWWVEVISRACANPNHLHAGSLHLRKDVPPSFRRFSLGPSRLGMVRSERRRHQLAEGPCPSRGGDREPLHAFRRADWLRPVRERGEGLLWPVAAGLGRRGHAGVHLRRHARTGSTVGKGVNCLLHI